MRSWSIDVLLSLPPYSLIKTFSPHDILFSIYFCNTCICREYFGYISDVFVLFKQSEYWTFPYYIGLRDRITTTESMQEEYILAYLFSKWISCIKDIDTFGLLPVTQRCLYGCFCNKQVSICCCFAYTCTVLLKIFCKCINDLLLISLTQKNVCLFGVHHLVTWYI